MRLVGSLLPPMSVVAPDHEVCTKPMKFRYVIGLGSNDGDLPAEVSLGEGRNRLVARSGATGLQSSSLYRSAPIDCAPETPNFVNAAISFHSGLTPLEMLDHCQTIEVELGRPRDHGHNQARSLDLDILVAGDLQCATSQLVLPHPRAHLRGFVLVPMAELDPALVIPGLLGTVAELLAELRRDIEDVCLLKRDW